MFAMRPSTCEAASPGSGRVVLVRVAVLKSFPLPKPRPISVVRVVGFGLSAFIVPLGVFVALQVAANQRDDLRVLFIGNSYTYSNDLPRMVAALARAGGQRPLHYEMETPGGYSLENHWNDGRALARVQARAWDFVVLQDQSQMPLGNRRAMFEYARRFETEIGMQGTKTILYMTWARLDRPDDQSPISQSYTELARELRARLAPVGNAWRTALAGDPQLVLHDADGSHPTPAGTYLTACVFYATLYGRSPEGLPGGVAGLSAAEALRLQTIAWQSVRAVGTSNYQVVLQ
jgi:hypothetical protein